MNWPSIRYWGQDEWFLAGIFSLFGVAIALVIAFEILHPCVRSEDRPGTCGGEIICNHIGDVTVCNPQPTYACTVSVCVERKP